MKTYLGKFLFIIVLTGLLGLAWGVKGTQLGQDLAGGAELRYGVTRRVTQRLQKLQQWLSELADPDKVKEKRNRVQEIERLLEVATGVERDRLRQEKSDLELALDRELLIEAITELERQQESVAAGASIIIKRLDPNMLGDIEVRTVGASRILIRIPYQRRSDETEEEARKRFEDRIKEIQNLVEQQGVLNFHLGISDTEHHAEYETVRKKADEGQGLPKKYFYVLPEEDYKEVAEKLKARGTDDPISAGYLPWSEPPKKRGPRGAGQESRRPLLLEREAVLNGTIIDRAYQRFREKGWEIGLDFTARGSGQFERVSGRNVGRQLAIVLDDIVYSAPVIQDKISRSAVITGSFTETEATDLATVLTAGSLPVQIEYESKSVVGPSLGRDSIRAGLTAFAVGAGAVVLFMLVYYLVGGFVAVLALALNLLIIMGALAAFNAKLTLPGIAGILLTVGMAVDANVLIFERIREEKARGRTLRLAIQAGYERAFVTIIDSNLTTILTALILYWFGSGPMKGFAVTLIIGIAASLFTALYVSQTIVDFLVARGWVTEMVMLRVIGKTSIPFMGIRPFTYALSVVVVCGALYAFAAYPDKYGIDFAGGTMLQVNLAQPVPDEEMREKAEAALAEMQGIENERSIEQGRSPIDFGSARVQAVVKPGETGGASSYSLMLRMDVHQLNEYRELLAERLKGQLKAGDEFPSQETIGQAVSEELAADAVRAIIFAVIVVFLYILMRFEFNPSFGVGAIVALAHDVAITVGALAAFDWLGLVPAKFDLTSVAAILTILGYSLNDTIVVYDRIREVRSGGRARPMREVVDEAINTVLSRSLITSFTTLLAAVALFVLGGLTTKGFALAMIVGVVAGTYSSSFIAAPIVVEWEKLRERPRLKKGLAIATAVLVVLALGGLVFQSIYTHSERLLEEEDKNKIVDVRNALRAYAMKHDAQFPKVLSDLVPDYLVDARALAGPGALEGTGYNYLTGLRSDDRGDSVLLYTPRDRLAYGGHVLFVDGRVIWMDERRAEAAIRATLNRFAGDAARSVHNVPATGAKTEETP